MKFEKDVFTSYDHLFDKPLNNGTTGWSIYLHKLLQTQLEQAIGHELHIRYHERDAGNRIIASKIAALFFKLKVKSSTINHYIGSDYRPESGVFNKADNRNGVISIGGNSDIFKVIKTPIGNEVIESLWNVIHKIFEILHCYFYIRDKATGKFKVLSRDSWIGNKIEQEFMDKLNNVVQYTTNLTKKINRKTNLVLLITRDGTHSSNPFVYDLLNNLQTLWKFKLATEPTKSRLNKP